MKRPLLGLLLLYAAGIGLGAVGAWPVAGLLAVAGALLIAWFFARHRAAAGPLLFATVFVLGAAGYRHAVVPRPTDNLRHLAGDEPGPVRLQGVVVSDPSARGGFELAVRAIERDGDWVPAPTRVYTFLRRGHAAAAHATRVAYGDLLECTARLRPPRPALNPGEFDWARWLAGRHISLLATIGPGDDCAVIAHDQANPLTATALAWRDRFTTALRAGLEDDPGRAGVLAGILIGTRSEIPADIYADFQRTGVFHIFSVSGLNVTLIAMVVVLVLRLGRLPRRWCGLVAIPLLVLYVFATGGRPSAVRALVMAVVFLSGWALVRPLDLLNSLAAAALIILGWDPVQLGDGGFQLSFASVTALVMLTPPIEARLKAWCAPDPFLPPALVPRWRRTLAKPIARGAQWLACALAAWIGLLPLMAWYFHLFTPVSVLANVVVIPVISGITAAGLLAMAAHPVWPWLAVVCNNANWFLLGILVQVVDWLGRLPLAYWFVRAPPWWAVVGFYGLIGAACSRRLAPWRRPLGAATGLAVTAWVVVAALSPLRSVELTALAVDRGAATLVDGPGWQGGVLINGGDDREARSTVLPFLRAAGVDRLGGLVLARHDQDHAAGLVIVADNIGADRAWDSGLGPRSRSFNGWRATLAGHGIEPALLRAGSALDWGVGSRLRVLHPPADWTTGRRGAQSLVLAVEHRGHRVLLLGDASDAVERALVAQGEDLAAAAILREVPAAGECCTPEFLDAVRPQAVVLVTSRRRATAAKVDALAARLAARGIRLYRTDQTGAVLVRLAPGGVTLRPWRE